MSESKNPQRHVTIRTKTRLIMSESKNYLKNTSPTMLIYAVLLLFEKGDSNVL